MTSNRTYWTLKQHWLYHFKVFHLIGRQRIVENRIIYDMCDRGVLMKTGGSLKTGTLMKTGGSLKTGILMKTGGSLKSPTILMTLFVVIFRINKGICVTTTQFQIYINKAAAVPIVISSEEVVSLTHCASLCSSNQLCRSFSLDCFQVLSSRQICELHSSSVPNVLDLVPSDTCYIQKGSAPPMLPTTITTTTTGGVPSTTVIDMVYGPRDMCPSGLSNEDFLVLTTAGVYVYDEITDLTIAPCDGPVPFTSIFQGYSSIPTIEMTKGLLIFQSTTVELYSDGIVYTWQIESGKLSSVLGSLTYSVHLGTTELDDKNFKWAAHRQGSSVERHFYLGDDQFLLRSNQYGTKTFSKTDEVFDNNGFNMNPWSDIPTDTVAVAGYGFGTNKDYALVNSSGYVYTYHVDHAANNNNPTKALTQQGLIKFITE